MNPTTQLLITALALYRAHLRITFPHWTRDQHAADLRDQREKLPPRLIAQYILRTRHAFARCA
jgi:hypothetical protein